MKIIVTENQNKFIRRYQQIQSGIWDFVLLNKLNVYDKFDDFLTELSWYVAGDIIRDMNIPEDEYVTYRNQLIQFIRNNFYTELKEFWDRNTYLNESKVIPSELRRRIQKFEQELNITLRESDPCEYSRFDQYKRGIMNYTLIPFLDDEGISLDSKQNVFDIRDLLIELFENKIREHYDAYSEMYCPDDPEIVTESLTDLMLRRRYDDIKSWVRSDYNFLLDRGETPKRAKEMTLDHSAGTYLDNEDNEIEFTGKNFEKLSIFIEDNFEDFIS
jgi:hypothetical protein